jgi:hypothetical protein
MGKTMKDLIKGFMLVSMSLSFLSISPQMASADVTYSVLSGTDGSGSTGHAEASGDGASVQAEVPLSLTIPKGIALAVSNHGSALTPGGLFGSTNLEASTLTISKRIDQLKTDDGQPEFIIKAAVASNAQEVDYRFPATVTLNNGYVGEITLNMSGIAVYSGFILTPGGANAGELGENGVERFNLFGAVDASSVSPTDRAGEYTGNLVITATVL